MNLDSNLLTLKNIGIESYQKDNSTQSEKVKNEDKNKNISRGDGGSSILSVYDDSDNDNNYKIHSHNLKIFNSIKCHYGVFKIYYSKKCISVLFEIMNVIKNYCLSSAKTFFPMNLKNISNRFLIVITNQIFVFLEIMIYSIF